MKGRIIDLVKSNGSKREYVCHHPDQEIELRDVVTGQGVTPHFVDSLPVGWKRVLPHSLRKYCNPRAVGCICPLFHKVTDTEHFTFIKASSPLPGVSEDMGLYPPPPLNVDYIHEGGGWIRERVEGQHHSITALQPDGVAFVLLVLAL